MSDSSDTSSSPVDDASEREGKRPRKTLDRCVPGCYQAAQDITVTFSKAKGYSQRSASSINGQLCQPLHTDLGRRSRIGSPSDRAAEHS